MIDKRRILPLNQKAAGSGPVLYVMAREARVEDNWALWQAQTLAQQRSVPLLVLFAVSPMFAGGSARHNEWMIGGLQAVERNLRKYNLAFFVECGPWIETVASFVNKHQVGEVILDFNPLEPVAGWRLQLANKLSVAVRVIDAHNVVPCWVTSHKAEFAAYTIRPKIHRLLSEFLVLPPPLTINTVSYDQVLDPIDWAAVRSFRGCDYSEPIPSLLVPGEEAARQQLDDFIEEILPHYETKRNNPTEKGTSGLSPYIRFGHISVIRIALAVLASAAPKHAKEAFLEELIVRRELAENYCYYTKNYATLQAAHSWAQTTLFAHSQDKRDYLYDYAEFRDALTHDDLWNAAQRQMIEEGKMHGYMRMYWAKKILEWTPDPQTAIDIALKLNDYFELDGRDSSGVVGVMWSICGLHDRAWNERPIFGKIRYMNYAGCKRKFDVRAYIDRYGRSGEDLFGVNQVTRDKDS